MSNENEYYLAGESLEENNIVYIKDGRVFKRPADKPVAWIDCKDRMPTKADAMNRMAHVIWMSCDGFVCEPFKARWDIKNDMHVAWMPIPPHPKWYKEQEEEK
jgi:hypothetical protein